eukprot:6175550-Pleurochrysis_carterae.AAC.2
MAKMRAHLSAKSKTPEMALEYLVKSFDTLIVTQKCQWWRLTLAMRLLNAPSLSQHELQPFEIV